MISALPYIALSAGLAIHVAGQTVVFSDVPAKAWYAPRVQAAVEAGVMQGYRDSQGKLTGKFGPANPVTRAEFLKMIAMMMINRYTFDRSTTPSGEYWYIPYLNIVKSKDPNLIDIIPVDDTSMQQPILRHEAAGLLHLGLGDYDQPLPYADPSPFPDVSGDTPNATAITELHIYGAVAGEGTTGRFFPFRTLNRAEAAALLAKTASAYQTPLGPNALP